MFKGIQLKLIILSVLVLGCYLAMSLGVNTIATAMTENTPIQNRYTVVIDAGHGGEDGGAVSCSGVRESKLNLEIALKANDLLHLLGINTRMVRTTDCSVSTEGTTIASRKASDLKNRVQFVNETEQGILVSIHQNYYSSNKYSGAQVFYSDSDSSKQLAELIQSCFVRTLNPGSNRKIKTAEGIYIMENVTCPAVLVECGFLSNFKEEANLRDETYQKKIAVIIVSCLSRYVHDDMIT